MICKHCNKPIERCTHGALYEEIGKANLLLAAMEQAKHKIGEAGVVMVTSLISHRTQKPRIDIQVGDIHTQMDADSAVDLAKNIIEVSEGAYADAFLFHFVTEQLGQDQNVAGVIISDFRDYRESLAKEFRELQKHGPTSSEEGNHGPTSS